MTSSSGWRILYTCKGSTLPSQGRFLSSDRVIEGWTRKRSLAPAGGSMVKNGGGREENSSARQTPPCNIAFACLGFGLLIGPLIPAALNVERHPPGALAVVAPPSAAPPRSVMKARRARPTLQRPARSRARWRRRARSAVGQAPARLPARRLVPACSRARRGVPTSQSPPPSARAGGATLHASCPPCR